MFSDDGVNKTEPYIMYLGSATRFQQRGALLFYTQYSWHSVSCCLSNGGILLPSWSARHPDLVMYMTLLVSYVPKRSLMCRLVFSSWAHSSVYVDNYVWLHSWSDWSYAVADHAHMSISYGRFISVPVLPPQLSDSPVKVKILSYKLPWLEEFYLGGSG